MDATRPGHVPTCVRCCPYSATTGNPGALPESCHDLRIYPVKFPKMPKYFGPSEMRSCAVGNPGPPEQPHTHNCGSGSRSPLLAGAGSTLSHRNCCGPRLRCAPQPASKRPARAESHASRPWRAVRLQTGTGGAAPQRTGQRIVALKRAPARPPGGALPYGGDRPAPPVHSSTDGGPGGTRFLPAAHERTGRNRQCRW